MSKIICVHGFGVKADGRGMFTDIAKNISEHDFVMFNLNEIDEKGNVTVNSFKKQARILETQIKNNPDADTLICHSQGCIVAGLADIQQIKKVIFLAPVQDLDTERFMSIFDRPGAVIDLSGESTIPRRDGTTTYVGKEYVDIIKEIDVPSIYKNLIGKVNLVIVRATKDEILGNTDFSYLNKVDILDLPASHDFIGESRRELIRVVRELI